MRLFILRHGQAETFAASDSERRLTDTGRNEVRLVVRRNAEDLSQLSRVWVSPLCRAQQTAELALETLGSQIPRETSDLLLPESTPSHVLELLGNSADGNYLLVSHQPLVGELVSGLCGKANGYYPMGTGAMACIELEYPALSCGNLLWLR